MILSVVYLLIVYMNKQNTLSQLENFGFDALEAKIYLHLLENGPRTHLELSREANIDRSKIYRGIEKLIKNKLIEQSADAWGKKLKAASPQNINLLMAEREESLKAQRESLPELIHNLNSIPSFSKREFEIKHYRGQEGLRQMLWNQLYAKDEILAFSYKNKNDIVGKPYAEKIRTLQVEKKIKLFEIENETDQKDYWYTNVSEWSKYYESRHISPKILKINQYIAIFNNTVAIINWLDREEVGLEIINSSYADMQKQLFRKFWQIADKK